MGSCFGEWHKQRSLCLGPADLMVIGNLNWSIVVICEGLEGERIYCGHRDLESETSHMSSLHFRMVSSMSFVMEYIAVHSCAFVGLSTGQARDIVIILDSRIDVLLLWNCSGLFRGAHILHHREILDNQKTNENQRKVSVFFSSVFL